MSPLKFTIQRLSLLLATTVLTTVGAEAHAQQRASEGVASKAFIKISGQDRDNHRQRRDDDRNRADRPRDNVRHEGRREDRHRDRDRPARRHDSDRRHDNNRHHVQRRDHHQQPKRPSNHNSNWYGTRNDRHRDKRHHDHWRVNKYQHNKHNSHRYTHNHWRHHRPSVHRWHRHHRSYHDGAMYLLGGVIIGSLIADLGHTNTWYSDGTVVRHYDGVRREGCYRSTYYNGERVLVPVSDRFCYR